MRSRRRILWAASIAVGFIAGSCKKTEAPPLVDDPLIAAIEAQGGVKVLKAASAYSSRYQATLLGNAINGKAQQKRGVVRLEYVAPSGDPVVQVAGDGLCWQKVGQVVLPCHTSLLDHTNRLARLLEATLLWPLKERADRKVKASKVTRGGKTFDGLAITGEAGEELGTLLVDPSTYLVVGLTMQTTLMGRTGELVGTFSEFEQACGVQVATRREYTFSGQPYLSEKIDGVLCEAIADQVFERPEQVKHKTVAIKHTFDTPIACTKLKGPLSGVSGAMGKVVDYLATQRLAPTGAAVLIHRQGPPRVKQPARFLTDVCFPVHKKAWVVPAAVWKGEVFLGDIVGDEVLVAYGVGELESVTVELAGLLVEEARKRGRQQGGAPHQIVYMRPEDYPADQRVSEMFLPLQ